MSGFFGVASKADCVQDIFYGTDYHSHLGTRRGGLAVRNGAGYQRVIHDISNSQFRSKFSDDIAKMSGNSGIGVISDYESQPLIVGSHLGTYAIVTVGKVRNIEALTQKAYANSTHFSEMSGGEVNPTEMVATLINQEESFTAGLRNAQEKIEGSCSILLLTDEGIYAARDRFGRTPIVLGQREGAFAVSLERAAFPNLGFEPGRALGPGEIVLMRAEGVEQKQAPGDRLQICSFMWVYFGYPASTYEGINAEAARYDCGAALARRDDVEVDLVAGIPDSGTAHALGYANEAKIPYRRPFVKYTPTWPRSFMPPNQNVRELVANMKLIPIRELVKNQRMLFCDDSIVRGTQLKNNTSVLYDRGAREVHIRVACPPLIHGCKFLNFSRSQSDLDLISRRVIQEIEGRHDKHLDEYAKPCSAKCCAMVEKIRAQLGVTSLKYQRLEDLVKAIGLPKEKLCTYCWDGVD
jgi:amidophosphoribosyltransferase